MPSRVASRRQLGTISPYTYCSPCSVYGQRPVALKRGTNQSPCSVHSQCPSDVRRSHAFDKPTTNQRPVWPHCPARRPVTSLLRRGSTPWIKWWPLPHSHAPSCPAAYRRRRQCDLRERRKGGGGGTPDMYRSTPGSRRSGIVSGFCKYLSGVMTPTAGEVRRSHDPLFSPLRRGGGGFRRGDAGIDILRYTPISPVSRAGEMIPEEK